MVSHRFAAAVALAAAAVLLLAGCTASEGTTSSATSTPKSVAQFYDQKLNWKSCHGSGFDCTTVTTPIDWAHPSKGSIKLALIRHKTTSKASRVGSLLVNPGGPGGSGYDFVEQSLDYAADASLQKSFDVVGWDPRGVGRSAPISCLSDKAMDTFLYATPANTEGSDAWLQDQVPKEQAFAAACKKNTGALLGHIDAESNARDMDLMRAVLGDKKLNYLGFSYGTFFGEHYAKLFPKKVGRLVLDGPVDPSIGEPQDFTTQMGGFESAYRAYLADCLTGQDCPFSGTLETALAQSKTLFDGVAARKLVASDGRMLTEGDLGTAISYPLYSEEAWPQLSQMLTLVKAGKPDAAFQFADAYNDRNSKGHYSSDADVYTAALCLDGVFPSDLAGTRATMNTIAAAAPTIGAILSYSDWVHVSIACQNWPYKSVLQPEQIHAAGAAPIMIVGTTNDPATPYSGAVSIAKQLDKGFLVTRKGQGHTAYGSGNTCIDDTVDAYLVKGTVPATDPLC